MWYVLIGKAQQTPLRSFLYLKIKDDFQKSSFRHREPIQNFFIASLPILVRCKRKTAAGAVCNVHL
jgi:hypothetical protein